MAIRTVNDARNPRWDDPDHTKLVLEVDFDELDEVYVEFCASPDDSQSYGVDLYNRAIAGEFGEISAYVAPNPITGEEAMAQLRAFRNAHLERTDYIESPTRWATLSTEEQEAWTIYRTALRDLPNNYPNAEIHFNSNAEITWVNCEIPVMPS